MKNQSSTTAQNGEATGGKIPENSASSLSPCANRFYPVKNGWRRNYDNTVGGKSSSTEEYKDGDASFDEIKVGKAWATVYEAKGTSQMGAIEMTETINNKIVSLEDRVKTSAGTFKAVKIEMDINADMSFGGNKMPVPKINSAA